MPTVVVFRIRRLDHIHVLLIPSVWAPLFNSISRLYMAHGSGLQLSEMEIRIPTYYNTDSKNNEYVAVSGTDNYESRSTTTTTTTFIADHNDMGELVRDLTVESRNVWYLAGPTMLTILSQYSLGFVTQVFAGHIGTLALAAVSVEDSVIAGFSFGVMLGMGSALETLCGQAYGAGKLPMLGIYMQRSWLILNTSAILLIPIYIFATPLLNVLGQTPPISDAAGRFAVWMIPQLFAYAVNFPIAKFLQAQGKVWVMAWISVVALIGHVLLSWVVMIIGGFGVVGAAVVLNWSWWCIVVGELVYVWGWCGDTWGGFSRKAFVDLWGFVRLSMASAIMLCLEVWYFRVLILFAGYLKNAELSIDALSICMNILGWTVMVAFGFSAAISVRVSNELGAGHPKAAKFSVIVVIIYSFLFGLLLALTLIIFRNQYPKLFSSSPEVQNLVSELTPLLALAIVIDSLQPVLSGVAIGAGWQTFVAYVNVGCFYILGIPLGLILGYMLDMGIKGIWYGMMSGMVAQTFVLFWTVYITNWDKEASMAGDRIKKWGGGGHLDFQQLM